MEVLTDRENSHAYDLAAESPEDTGVSGRKNVPSALVQPDGEVVKKLFSDSLFCEAGSGAHASAQRG